MNRPHVGSERSAGPGHVYGGNSEADFENDPNAVTSSQSVKVGSPGALAVKFNR